MPQPTHNWRPLPESPVVVLRETAWQLDQSAHRLEMLDLYDQADALRETAAVLRGDARVMKEEGTKAKTAGQEAHFRSLQESRPEQSADQR